MRPLGANEAMFAWVQHTFGALTVACACRMQGKLNVDVLAESFQAIYDADASLSGTLIGPASKTPMLAYQRTAPAVVSTIPLHTHADWQRELQASVNRPFLSSINSSGEQVCGSLCSLSILYGDTGLGADAEHAIILRVHHSVCDGRRLVVLLSRLFSLYHARLSGDTSPPQSFGPFESLESRIPRWRRLLATGRLIRANLVGGYRSIGQSSPFPTVAKPTDSLTNIAFESLDANETSCLVQRCREHQTTVNAAIASATMFAVNDITGFRGNLCLQSTFDFFNTTDIPLEASLGTFSFSQTTWHQPHRFGFWELAENYRRIQQTGAGTNAIPPLGFYRLARPFLRSATKRGRFAKITDIGLSNLGRVATPTNCGELRLTEFCFASAQTRLGGTAVVNAATLAGRLSLTCATPAHIAPAIGSHLLNRVKQRLTTETVSLSH